MDVGDVLDGTFYKFSRKDGSINYKDTRYLYIYKFTYIFSITIYFGPLVHSQEFRTLIWLCPLEN